MKASPCSESRQVLLTRASDIHDMLSSLAARASSRTARKTSWRSSVGRVEMDMAEGRCSRRRGVRKGEEDSVVEWGRRSVVKVRKSQARL